MTSAWTAGSPPRVWGQLFHLGVYVFHCAVHPHACGDNTSRRFFRRAIRGSPPRVWGQPARPLRQRHSRAVHPHACGDNLSLFGFGLALPGSPPRVWGQLDSGSAAFLDRLVHPHACGDNACRRLTPIEETWFTPTRVGTTSGLLTMIPPKTGSPPRVWGQLWGWTPGEGAHLVHPHACGDNGAGAARGSG